MMRKNGFLKSAIAILLVLIFLSSCAVGSQPTTENSEPAVTAQAGNDAASGAAAAETGVTDMGDTWNTFRFTAAGDVYQLPMLYAQFTEMGWAIPQGYTVRTETILPDRYVDVTLKKGDLELKATVTNLDVSGHPYQDCFITDIKASSTAEGLFLLPCNLTPNQSSFDDVIAAYGEKHSQKKESYNSESYTIEYANYKEDGSKNNKELLTLSFNAETDLMDWCKLTCKTVPADFEPSKADSKPYLDYLQPTAQSKDLNDAVFSYDGVLYQLPCPISAFLDNGWTHSEVFSDSLDEELPAGYSAYVHLEYKTDYCSGRDAESGSHAPFGKYLAFHVVNNSTSVQLTRNCAVEKIEFKAYDSITRSESKEDAAAQFSKKIGFAFPIATKADIEKANTANNLNMEYSMTSSDNSLRETYKYQTEDKYLCYSFYYTDGTLDAFTIDLNL